ncbi:hypothetical protein ACQRWP_23555 [Micromonospora trifolii]|uniref:hypothetical protein n=1 Tax=Micromonospora trifolii TaxID=2911208 RepID=UPI003D2F1498
MSHLLSLAPRLSRSNKSVTLISGSGEPGGCLGGRVVVPRSGQENGLEEVALLLLRIVVRCERPPKRKIIAAKQRCGIDPQHRRKTA